MLRLTGYPAPVDPLAAASDCRSTRLGQLRAILLLLTAIGFGFGPLRWMLVDPPGHVPDAATLTLGIWLGWAWLALFGAALALHRRRALWLLPAAPFVLVWPALWIVARPGCSLLGCG